MKGPKAGGDPPALVMAATQAADQIIEEGRKIAVVNARFVKPLDEKLICDIARRSKKHEGEPSLLALRPTQLTQAERLAIELQRLVEVGHADARAERELIVEHLRGLDQLTADQPFRFFAAAVKVKAFGTFPVRAFAIVESA